jgi:hypothetical protein
MAGDLAGDHLRKDNITHYQDPYQVFVCAVSSSRLHALSRYASALLIFVYHPSSVTLLSIKSYSASSLSFSLSLYLSLSLPPSLPPSLPVLCPTTFTLSPSHVADSRPPPLFHVAPPFLAASFLCTDCRHVPD